MKRIFILNILFIFIFFSKNVISQTVWGFGYNYNGELGIGKDVTYEVPVLVKNLSNVVSISAGGYHSIALKNNGTVWAWGANFYEQLGNWDFGDMESHENIPVKVVTVYDEELKDVIKVSAGYAHTLALKSDGTVWAWGWNKYGQLGNGNNEDQNIPVMVSNLTGVIEILCGDHCLALKSDGTVWAWGWNKYGQLGNGNNEDQNIPIQVQKVSNIVSIFAGRLNSFAIDRDGKVYGWGRNKFGQLGDGTTNDSNVPVEINLLKEMGIVQIKSNYYSTLAMDKEGNVWVWGKTPQGDSLTPIKVERIKNAIFIERGISSSSFAISQSEHKKPF